MGATELVDLAFQQGIGVVIDDPCLEGLIKLGENSVGVLGVWASSWCSC
ncbi:MAG: hypothetical protein U5P41_09815 [Gammaproteobacteria bacterium]|nr:hypothetical protein [Gammaproteobacteria bacterium]